MIWWICVFCWRTSSFWMKVIFDECDKVCAPSQLAWGTNTISAFFVQRKCLYLRNLKIMMITKASIQRITKEPANVLKKWQISAFLLYSSIIIQQVFDSGCRTNMTALCDFVIILRISTNFHYFQMNSHCILDRE